MTIDQAARAFALLARGYLAEQRLRAIITRTWVRACKRKLDEVLGW